VGENIESANRDASMRESCPTQSSLIDGRLALLDGWIDGGYGIPSGHFDSVSSLLFRQAGFSCHFDLW
jgi:hypothetical protein